jgi:hypothetical protein
MPGSERLVTNFSRLGIVLGLVGSPFVLNAMYDRVFGTISCGGGVSLARENGYTVAGYETLGDYLGANYDRYSIIIDACCSLLQCYP